MKKGEGNRIILGIIVFVMFYFVQLFLGKTGHFIADLIPYQSIDPYDCFARNIIHHTVELVIALGLIYLLSKLLHLDFYFQLGDKKTGMKYLGMFTAAFLVITIVQHILMIVNDQLPVYAFPLDTRNVIGTLGFQLFLTGPAEEVVCRALPITLITYAFGKSVKIKDSVTLEVILASIIFSLAHASISFIPFSFEANYFQLIYAFALGMIQGITYQKTKSILYPILMHSISNLLIVGGGYLFVALFA